MRRNKVDVTGISEVRCKQSDEFRIFNSSGSDGVGIVLCPCVRDKLISVSYVVIG